MKALDVLAAARVRGYLIVQGQGNTRQNIQTRNAWFRECERERNPYVWVSLRKDRAFVEIDVIAQRHVELDYRAVEPEVRAAMQRTGRRRKVYAYLGSVCTAVFGINPEDADPLARLFLANVRSKPQEPTNR